MTTRRSFMASTAAILAGGCIPSIHPPEAVDDANTERVRRIVMRMNSYRAYRQPTYHDIECTRRAGWTWAVRYYINPQFPPRRDLFAFEKNRVLFDGVIRPGQHCTDHNGKVLPWAPGYYVVWHSGGDDDLPGVVHVRSWS